MTYVSGELAAGLADMARNLLTQESVQGTLDQIVAHAVDLVDGCEDAGVLVIEGNEGVRTIAGHSALVRASDKLQQELGEGPCFDVTRRAQVVYRIHDITSTAGRWRRFAPRAQELGIGSIMGFCLYTEDDNLGALNMYSSQPGAFTEASEQVGWLLASHAAVAFSSARSHAQLTSAIETRNVIGQAMGILMERYKVSESEAFVIVKKSSQNTNTRLRDVARTIAETGEIPGSRIG
ncbi:GAF and ANTAR domain-containing protein [Streptomyces bathyalis]|uniref:GAF and ANTAR domain-containing protein n=1 Tax=Streptomyces bathyalis TaxID=2710756 RepID=A0A7T1T2J1_9ACTN|nr:GAF and ANTAR domain-containing protein [Streptomyces bathyalis]QPP05220.1 GAF and ANTAR domain-containing protein [Streptomyces bathyalis]